jgi:hypothetical protein
VTLLYRTPNIVMAGADWHATIEWRNGKARKHFRFRLSGQMWQPLAEWPGHKPKGAEFCRAFRQFKCHMLHAERSVEVNARALGVAA